MIFLPILGFSLIGSVNFYSFIKGYKNYTTGDKDILYPFSSFIFFFFPLLIYLPEVHYKLTNFKEQTLITAFQKAKQQDQSYPMAFLLALVSISIGVFIDKFLIQEKQQNQQIQERNSLNQSQSTINSSITKYLLTLSIGFLNIVNCFYITIQNKDASIFNELFIFLIFSLIVNFSFGYLLAWAKIQYEFGLNLNIFTNCGLLIGWLLGLVINKNILLLILLCLAAGLQIYTSMFVCFKSIFSNGQNSKQDKFRFGAIFTALLLSIIYYPTIYLLRV